MLGDFQDLAGQGSEQPALHLTKRYPKVSSNLNKLYYSIKQNYALIGEALCV